VITVEDPRNPEVLELLERHHAHSRATTPPEDIHALDAEGLAEASVTFYVCRENGSVLGTAALKELDAAHGEVKSMHTLEEARGRGVATALLGHVIAEARRRGYERLSLETGAMDAFAPARALYIKAGFTPCAPFANYPDSANSAYLTLAL
jgi:putative acetyltransferase